jgi:Leucine-rich repeat (LRR) protein
MSSIVDFLRARPSLTAFPPSNTYVPYFYLHDKREECKAFFDALALHDELTALRLVDKHLTCGYDCCRLERLCDEFACLSSLVDLNLSGNWSLYTRDMEPLWRLTGLETLNLSGCELGETPAGLGRLTKLTKLFLDSCDLRSLPESVDALTSLRVLSLRSNHFRYGLPDAFCRLRALETLDLSKCGLQCLPAAFGQLTSLRHLTLDKSSLVALPDSFGDLQSLTRLSAHTVPLAKLPDSFYRLCALTHLRLRCRLECLPAGIGKLLSLRELDVASNRLRLPRDPLRFLPETLADLPALTLLNVSHNKMCCLPSSFFKMRSLRVFDCVSCRDSDNARFARDLRRARKSVSRRVAFQRRVVWVYRVALLLWRAARRDDVVNPLLEADGVGARVLKLAL